MHIHRIQPILFLSILFLIVLYCAPAFAHRPYVVKINSIEDHDGKSVIVEKLYGDGIFGPDPVSLQIRNHEGVAIASSPVGQFLTAFCPHIEFCFAMPHTGPFILAPIWKLDYKNLNFSEKRGADKLGNNDEEEEEFSEYITNKRKKSVSSNDFGYPEMAKSSSDFIKISNFFIIFSPLFAIIGNLPALFGFMLITICTKLINEITKTKQNNSEKIIRYLWRNAQALNWLAYGLLVLILPLLCSVMMNTPILYSYAFLMLGAIIYQKIIKKQKGR